MGWNSTDESHLSKSGISLQNNNSQNFGTMGFNPPVLEGCWMTRQKNHLQLLCSICAAFVQRNYVEMVECFQAFKWATCLILFDYTDRI
jgi:hypothetical protein